MAHDERTAERVRSLLSARHDIVEKKLMGGLCFMVKGAMCCSVSGRGGLLIRVGSQARERMLDEPHVRPMEMGARTVTGFVRVMPEGYRTETSLRKWIQRGLDFAATLSAGAPQGRSLRRQKKRPKVRASRRRQPVSFKRVARD